MNVNARVHFLKRTFQGAGLPVAMGLCAFLLYALTGARTIQWQDSAQFTYRVAAGELGNEYGLAMAHPLHFRLGRMAVILFPNHVPWAVSLVSALGGGAAVGMLVHLLQRLGRRTETAVFGGMSLMLAHTFWRFSGLPEVYTLSAALLLAQIVVFVHLRENASVRGWALLFALNGLSFSNHNMALLALPTWGLAWLSACRQRPGFWKSAPVVGLGWLAGSLPYTAWILAEMIGADAWMPVLRSALFGNDYQSKVTAFQPEGPYFLISLAFLALSLPVTGVLAFRGAWNVRRVPWPVYTVLGLHLLFFLRYNVIDQYTFFIPSMALIALLGGIGFDCVSNRHFRRLAMLAVLLQPVFYAMSPMLAESSGVMRGFLRNKPHRDDHRYLLHPWQVTERSADRLMREAFDAVGEKGLLVVEDDMAVYSARWMRLERGLEEEVRLIRPPDLDDLPQDAEAGTIVWVPARADSPTPEGWRKQEEVWVRE